MTSSDLARLLTACIIGLIVGAVFALVGVNPTLLDTAGRIPGLLDVYGAVHTPAEYMADLWNWVGLPPHGDGAMVWLFPAAVVAQWLGCGAILGLLRCWRSRQKEPSR